MFSTSKDHNQGNNAMAGCILIDFEKMQVINRSPAYRNQYVHRRDSVSLAMLSEAEIKERVQLGLIEGHTGQEEEFEEEEWEEFDEDELNTSREENDSSLEDDEEYVFDDRRKSSVDPGGTRASPPGSSHDSHEFDVESSGVNPKRIDFSGEPRKGRGAFSTITEEDEDEESTVNGDEDDEAMEAFDETENDEPPSSSTTVSPLVRKFNIR